MKEAADGTEINNVGVHFAVNTAASMWAEAADYGYEDVIVIAPQYYSGNQPRKDGYERDDAMRAAFCYALANFAVDRDRVYVTGTSQGAGRTTALLRDCADYITAIVVQNGGYSSYLSKREGGRGDAREDHEVCGISECSGMVLPGQRRLYLPARSSGDDVHGSLEPV